MKNVTETSELDDILSPQIMNLDVCPECYVDFAQAKQQILRLIREARVNELLGLKYALNVDKDAYMHRILDLRIKTIEGQTND